MTEEETNADFLSLVTEFARTIHQYVDRKKDSKGMVEPGPLLIVLAALTDLSVSQQAFTIEIIGIPREIVHGTIGAAVAKAMAVTRAQVAEWRETHGKLDS